MFKNVPHTRFAHAAQFGSALALISIVFALIQSLATDPVYPNLIVAIPIGLASLALYIIWTRIAMLSWRNQVNGGFMTFGNAFRYFAVYSIFTTVIGAVFNLINLTLIHPDYMERTRQKLYDTYTAMGYSDSMAEKMVEMGTAFSSPFVIFIFTVTLGYGMVLLIGLIFAAVLKKDPPANPMHNIPPQVNAQMEGYQQMNQQQQFQQQQYQQQQFQQQQPPSQQPPQQ